MDQLGLAAHSTTIAHLLPMQLNKTLELEIYSFLSAIFIPSFTNFSDSVPLTLILTISQTFLVLILVHISSCFLILSSVKDLSHFEQGTVCNDTLVSLSGMLVIPPFFKTVYILGQSVSFQCLLPALFMGHLGRAISTHPIQI